MAKPEIVKKIHSGFAAQIYKGENKEWWWRVVAVNGQIIAISGEGYKKRSHALGMVDALFPQGEVTEAPVDPAEPVEDPAPVSVIEPMEAY